MTGLSAFIGKITTGIDRVSLTLYLFASARAARTLSGVAGRWRTRAPHAFAIPFITAGAVAVAGLDMKVYGKHLRKSELDQFAKAVGAKLIPLKGGDGKHKDGDVEVES